MSREGFESLAWDISNIEDGITRRESGFANASDLEEMKNRLARKKALRDSAIIICETEDQKNIMAENSWR